MEYVLTILAMIAIWTILAASFNLIIGYAGLLIIAHPIFYATGAYVAAGLTMSTGMPIPLAIALAIAASTALSVLVSVPCVRISGDYLLIASIGFLLGSLQVIRNLEVLGGAGGLGNIPGLFDGPNRSLYFLALSGSCAVLMLLFIRWIIGGDFGRVIVAMRDDEEALSGLGRNPLLIKVVLLAVGAGGAALAGSLYAFHFQFVSPDQFEVMAAAMMLAMVIVGGMGSTWGPLVGAAIMTALPELVTFIGMPTSFMAPVQGMIFTGVVILFLFLWPQGILGSRSLIAGSIVTAK